MLDIFFTNKIPSSSYEWTDELILVASIFNEFDGLPYERAAITDRFEVMSNRVPGARDAADYRDEYGAYASFLGLLRYEQSGNSWTCRTNQNAKELLCGVLPDPRSFVRLQMSLLQYPNPFGAAYNEDGTFRIEANTQAKRIEQVRSGVRTAPFRLLLRVLLALHDNYGVASSFLTYAEIWHCLFTQPDAVGTFDPNGALLAQRVMKFRANPIETYNTNALRNLHILKHTGLVDKPVNSSILELVVEAGDAKSELGLMARSIAFMPITFPVPDRSATDEEIQDWARQAIESDSWGKYYSGELLTATAVEILTKSAAEVENGLLTDATLGSGAPLLDFERERETRANRMSKRAANSEETEALREKANLAHRALVKLLSDRLRAQDVKPESNVYVDLCCRAPKKMLFEVKNCRPENLLSQVRKGVSQLYEYRYRHDELNEAKLVLALESRPIGQLDWLVDYLVEDRTIAICWLEGEDNLACPSWCQDCLGTLVNRIEQMP